MANRRLGGILFIKVDGALVQAKGNFSYNLGVNKRTGISGAGSVHGYKEEIVIPFIEGQISDNDELDVKALADLTDVTVTAELFNGKTIVLRNAWAAADWDISTEEGEIAFRFEGLEAEEVS